MGLLSGFAKINDFGVKVLEGDVASPIQISIDERRRTSVPRREQAPIATSTQHQQMITDALEKVITAINQADVSEQEKNEAKTLLRRLLGSKAAVSVLGPGAQSLAAKYLHGIKQRAGVKDWLAPFPTLGFAGQETVSLSENTPRPYSPTM